MNPFKRARLIAGLNQKELAEYLHVSVVAVHKWESGECRPKAKRLKEVANALQTSVEELLELDERRIG